MQASKRNPIRPLLRLLPLCFLLLGGCDFLVFTDEGLVKLRIRQHAEALSAKDWKKAAEFHDDKWVWKRGRSLLKGANATRAFMQSIQAIPKNDSFFTEVQQIKKLKPDQIAAAVIFQAHTIEDSMRMKYSNFTWRGRMLWVKRGNADWRILLIEELSPRKKGTFRRAGV